jgi:hypothetical protein
MEVVRTLAILTRWVGMLCVLEPKATRLCERLRMETKLTMLTRKPDFNQGVFPFLVAHSVRIAEQENSSRSSMRRLVPNPLSNLNQDHRTRHGYSAVDCTRAYPIPS